MKSNIYFSIPSHILPEIILANTVTIDLPYVHFKRIPTEYVLYIVVDGVMYLTEDEIDYTLKPGDLLLLDPARCHFGRQASRCLYYYIHFTLPGIEEHHLTEQEYHQKIIQQRMAEASPQKGTPPANHPVLLPKYTHMRSEIFARLENLAHDIQISFHTPLEFHYQQACCFLMSLFYTWGQTMTDYALEAAPIDIDYLAPQVMAYLKIYYYDKLTSEKLEEHFHRNFDYINRKFKKSTGYTVFQWLNNYRIAEAKKLLAAGYYNQGQIAEKTGFSNEFYFSRVFKKITGMTPSEYKKSISKPDVTSSNGVALE